MPPTALIPNNAQKILIGLESVHLLGPKIDTIDDMSRAVHIIGTLFFPIEYLLHSVSHRAAVNLDSRTENEVRAASSAKDVSNAGIAAITGIEDKSTRRRQLSTK